MSKRYWRPRRAVRELSQRDPRFAELVGAQGGYDYIEYVTEYSTFHMYDLDHVCRAADLYSLGTMVKIDQANQHFVAQRAIGAGFQAILFTDCRSAEDVRECVRICRPDTPEDGGYYPAAQRRNSLISDADGKDYVQAARDIVVCVMIEKRGAVEQIDEILEIPGLDMIQWGGTDYAMHLGLAFARDAPKVDEARRKVFEAALASKVPPRAEVSGPAAAAPAAEFIGEASGGDETGRDAIGEGSKTQHESGKQPQ